MLKKPVLMNDALYRSALVILALLPAAGRLPTLYIRQDLFQPFSKVNFHCSLLAWLPKEARLMRSSAVRLGSCFMYLPLPRLLQLVNLLGIFS